MDFYLKPKGIFETHLIADMHNDLPFHVYQNRKNGMHQVIETLYLKDILKGQVNLIVCAIYVDEANSDDWAGNAKQQINSLYDDVSESLDKLAICTTYEQICLTIASGRVALLISLEGCEPVTTVDTLDEFFEMGVRLVGLTWSRKNQCGDGCSFAPLSEYETPKLGLTQFGFKVLERAGRLGMLIDVSHLSEPSFKDVFSTGIENIFASHSNVQSVMPCRRNISDEQIKMIAQVGGVIGIMGVDSMVGGNDLVKGYCDHIDYVVRLIGLEYVALGVDLYSYFYENNTSMPKEAINGYSELHLIYEELTKRGYSQNQINSVLGTNFTNFIKNRL